MPSLLLLLSSVIGIGITSITLFTGSNSDLNYSSGSSQYITSTPSSIPSSYHDGTIGNDFLRLKALHDDLNDSVSEDSVSLYTHPSAEAVWKEIFINATNTRLYFNNEILSVFNTSEANALISLHTETNAHASGNPLQTKLNILAHNYELAYYRGTNRKEKRLAQEKLYALRNLIDKLNLHLGGAYNNPPSWIVCNDEFLQFPLQRIPDEVNSSYTLVNSNSNLRPEDVTVAWSDIFEKEYNKICLIPFTEVSNHGVYLWLEDKDPFVSLQPGWAFKNYDDLVSELKKCNDGNQKIIDDKNALPERKIVAQKKIDRLERLVQKLNSLVSSSSLCPPAFRNKKINIEFQKKYSDNKYLADVRNMRNVGREKFKTAINELFDKTWNNRWYTFSEAINERLYSADERNSLKDRLIASLGKNNNEDFKKQLKDIKDEAIAIANNPLYCVEHRHRFAKRYTCIQRFVRELDKNIKNGIDPWYRAHVSWDHSEEDYWSQIFREYVDIDVIGDDGNRFENINENVPQDKKWIAKLRICANSTVLSKEGRLQPLFTPEQRNKIAEFEREHTIADAKTKIQTKVYQIINLDSRNQRAAASMDDNSITADAHRTQTYRVRQIKALFGLANELGKYSESLDTSLLSDNDIVMAKAECVNKKIGNENIFTQDEKDRIERCFNVTGGISNVVLNLKLNELSLLSGVNFFAKGQAISDLVKKIQEITETRRAQHENNNEEDVLKQIKINPDFYISDEYRIRKRDVLNQNNIPNDVQEKYINIMNAIDTLELQAGCTLSDIVNLPELKEIEKHLAKLEKECEEKGFNKIENIRNETLNAERHKLTEEYFKIFDGCNANAIKNVIALNRVYLVLKFLLNINEDIKYDQKDFDTYIHSTIGERDGSVIEEIIKSYPSVIKMLSGWLFLNKNNVVTNAVQETSDLYNVFDEQKLECAAVNASEVVSTTWSSKFLYDFLLPQHDLNSNSNNIPQEMREKQIKAIMKKYDTLNNKDFIEYFYNKSGKKLFNCFSLDLPNKEAVYSGECLKFSSIAGLSSLANDFNDLKGLPHNIESLNSLSDKIRDYLLTIWGAGLGSIFTKVQEHNGTYVSPFSLTNRRDYNSSLIDWIVHRFEEFLNPQIQIAAYTFMKAVRFGEIILGTNTINSLNKSYKAYKEYARKNGKIPESLPVLLKQQRISLPSNIEDSCSIIMSYSLMDSATWNKGRYSQIFSNICQKLEELADGYKKIVENFDKYQEQKNKEVNEEANEEVNDESDEEWKKIAEESKDKSEWEKTFYDVYRSKDTNGEHIFEINEEPLVSVINECPKINNCGILSGKLQLLIGAQKRVIMFSTDEGEKTKVEARIKKIKELVIKLDKLIKQRKIPVGFTGEFPADVWEGLEQLEQEVHENEVNQVQNNEVKVINIGWDNFCVPGNADSWTVAFYKTFCKLDNEGKHIFDFQDDHFLIDDYPKVKTPYELYNSLTIIIDKAVSNNENSKATNKINAFYSLLKRLIKLQEKKQAPADFNGQLSLVEFERFFNNDVRYDEPNINEDLQQARDIMREIERQFNLINNAAIAGNNASQQNNNVNNMNNSHNNRENRVNVNNRNGMVPNFENDYITDDRLFNDPAFLAQFL